MIFGSSKKHCSSCGQKVAKADAVVRSGEYFCSEEHADQFQQKIEAEKSSSHGGSCCG